MVKWSVDDIYDIKKDESVCNSCYSPILWVHVIWSKQLFIVICLVFLVSRFPWGHSTTTWIKFDPILTTYPLEWKIVDILPIQSKDKLFYPTAWATAYGWRMRECMFLLAGNIMPGAENSEANFCFLRKNGCFFQSKGEKTVFARKTNVLLRVFL